MERGPVIGGTAIEVTTLGGLSALNNKIGEAALNRRWIIIGLRLRTYASVRCFISALPSGAKPHTQASPVRKYIKLLVLIVVQ